MSIVDILVRVVLFGQKVSPFGERLIISVSFEECGYFPISLIGRLAEYHFRCRFNRPSIWEVEHNLVLADYNSRFRFKQNP